MTSLALAFDILARDKASQEFDKVGDAAERAGEKGELFGSKIEAGMAVAAAAIGTGLVAGIAGAMNMDAANDKLAASLGLTATESERIGGIAGSLYADAYGESLEHVNSAVASVMTSIQGLGAGELEDVTATALDFASAFEVDVTRAAQIAGQAVSTGLAGTATEAFDLLTAASQKVPTALREDLLDAADEYGPFFAQLGLSGEQAFSALVAGSEKGMYGIDKTGDALKEFTIRATDMSKATVGAFDTIGLDANEMANALLAGGDSAGKAMSEIVDGLRSIEDPAEQANTAIALFGTPLEDLGTGQIPGFLDALAGAGGQLGDFEGAAQRMGDTLNDNAATNLESFKRQVTTTFVDFVGGKALPVVNEIASTLAEQFGPTLQKITGWMRENETAVGLVVSVLGGAAAAIGTIIAVTRTWAAVQALLNIVLTANPIGLVIVAIAALVAGLIYAWNNSETFRNIVIGVWEAVRNFVVGAATAVRDWVVGAWEWISSKTKAVWEAIKASILFQFNLVMGVVQKIRDFRDNVVNAFTELKDKAVAKATELVTWVTGLPGRLISAVGDLAVKFYTVGSDIIQGIINGVTGSVGRIKDAVTEAASSALSAAKDFLGISSPSRVFRDQVGAMLPAGMVQGILAGQGAVRSAMNSLVAIPSVGVPAMPGGIGMPVMAGAASGSAPVGAGATVVVNPSPGMDERMIGQAAANALTWAAKR